MSEENNPGEVLFLRIIFVAVIGLVIAGLIALGAFEDEKNSGPCEQYQTQEAFELCADSVYNG